MSTRHEKLIVLKNAAANVIRGGASALVALLLPPFLTRSMSADAFGAWSLILQLSAYVGYLDFGIQTAIARFVAHATERNDAAHRDRIVSTAFAFLTASGLAAFLGLSLLAVFLPHLFPRLPRSLLFDARLALLLVGGSLSVGLPASAFVGTFVGLQRNEIPAIIIGASRLLSAVLLIVIVRKGGGIAAMGVVVTVVNVTSYLVQFVFYRRVVARLNPKMSLSVRHVSRAAALELRDYCISLTVWGIGMILVTGLDLTVVGIYRFDQVGYYAVAAIIVTFLAGLFGAIFGAMGSPAAVLHAREDSGGLGRMVSVTTRLGMFLLLATGLPLIFGASYILRLWVGPLYAQHAAVLVQLLIVANISRLCVSPYIIALIGTGEQRRIILVPLLEGAANLISSVIAGYYLGAVGVALGTLIGSFVSLLGHLAYTMRRNIAIDLAPGEYFRNSFLRPMLCFIPIIVCGMLWTSLRSFQPVWLFSSLAIAAAVLSAVLTWYIGLMPNERQEFLTGARLMHQSMNRSHYLLKAK